METMINPINGCHVVAVPFPGRGHANPMINLCTLLIPSPKISTITLILTEEWLSLISHQLPVGSPKLRIRTIPNVLPSELTRGADLSGFYKAVYTKMEAPFEEVLLSIDSQRLEPPVTCIVYDAFLSWVVGVGRRRNIPVAAFWTQAPSVFSVYYHFDLIADRGHVPKDNLPIVVRGIYRSTVGEVVMNSDTEAFVEASAAVQGLFWGLVLCFTYFYAYGEASYRRAIATIRGATVTEKLLFHELS